MDSRRARAAGGTAKIDNRGQTVGNDSETETVWDQLRSIDLADAAVDERGRLTEPIMSLQSCSGKTNH